jgi:hypothetical protein
VILPWTIVFNLWVLAGFVPGPKPHSTKVTLCKEYLSRNVTLDYHSELNFGLGPATLASNRAEVSYGVILRR